MREWIVLERHWLPKVLACWAFSSMNWTRWRILFSILQKWKKQKQENINFYALSHVLKKDFPDKWCLCLQINTLTPPVTFKNTYKKILIFLDKKDAGFCVFSLIFKIIIIFLKFFFPHQLSPADFFTSTS